MKYVHKLASGGVPDPGCLVARTSDQLEGLMLHQSDKGTTSKPDTRTNNVGPLTQDRHPPKERKIARGVRRCLTYSPEQMCQRGLAGQTYVGQRTTIDGG